MVKKLNKWAQFMKTHGYIPKKGTAEYKKLKGKAVPKAKVGGKKRKQKGKGFMNNPLGINVPQSRILGRGMKTRELRPSLDRFNLPIGVMPTIIHKI
jgi:hypothetical protein